MSENKKPLFTTYTLPCGLRIICSPCPTQVVYCGIAVDAGTRDELPHESGMAHFVEHMSFKGTKKRSARQIINRLESVGGDLNAYTGKEETVFYSSVLKQHLPKAIELLLDITFNSTFLQEEMNKEVEVVIDEIESYNDQPSELIYDEFEEICFPRHPLGRNILGEASKLRLLTSEHMHDFHKRMYQPDKMVLFVYGNVDANQVIRLAEKALSNTDILPLSHPVAPLPRVVPSPFRTKESERIITKRKDTHQAHVIIGGRSFGGNDAEHLQLYLLNNMLGGPCLGSLFNLSLRERNGLVYNVESNATCYTDSGVWTTYFGCDPCDVKRCLRLVERELHKLTEAPLSQSKLNAARRQLKGQIAISYDNYESLAISIAKRFLHYGNTQTMQQLFDRLDALTPEQLWLTAQQVFDLQNLCTLIYK
ncbi:MAG: insulinase family protein [Bacteroidaceae bacterium]|nr:insulinase family protein [Bacteroidaceae bacterium]